MPKQLTEITAVFRREKIRWESTAIIECDEPGSDASKPTLGALDLIDFTPGITIKVTCDPDDFMPSLSYRFYGHWSEYTNRRTGKTERQFVAKTFVRCQPHGMAGIIKYLTQAPGIGHAIARQLWDKFQGDAVRILRESPEVAAAACQSLREEPARAASLFLVDEQAMEDCTIDLIDLLGGRGFPKSTAKATVQEWGNRAAELIKRNPYLLMRFRGCGFLRCDQLYLDQGGDPARIKRQAYCAWYALARDTNGHTWHTQQVVEAGLRGMVSGSAVRGQDAAKLAVRGKLLSVCRRDGKLWLAEGKKARNEKRLAELVAAMLQEPVHWPAVDGLDVSDHQRAELAKALQAPLAIFSGSPGTGKTYSAARVIGALVEECGVDQVAVCAPTGKAAVRITEAMQGYGLPLKAKTIHSLLGVQGDSAGDGWALEHNEANPLKHRFIVVDESSMIDTDLACSLFRARAKGTHILLVGDTAQLLPVGHGAPLRDLTTAGVPSGMLTEIKRNGGSIVRACAEIRQGQRFAVDERLSPADGTNLKAIDGIGGVDGIKRRLVNVLRKLGEQEHDGRRLDPVWDCQVIVAVNDRSQLSRKKLNELLQREFNPAAGDGKAKNGGFLPGDKIVCTKNGFLPLVDDAAAGLSSGAPGADEIRTNDKGDVFIANGELGQILRVENGGAVTVARFDAPRREVKILRSKEAVDAAGKAGKSRAGATREGDSEGGDGGGDSDGGTGCNFELGYAISCHKSQGSEWPVVIVVLDDYPGARMVCSREWLYTAISRGKTAVLLLGNKAVADGMVKRPALHKRKTFLAELMREEVARLRPAAVAVETETATVDVELESEVA